MGNGGYCSDLVEKGLWLSILDYSSDGLLLAGAKGEILAYNAAWRALALADQSRLPKNVKQFSRELPDGTATAVEVLHTKKSCSNVFRSPAGRVLLSTGKPIFKDGGTLQYVLVNIRDISSALSLRDTVEHADRVRKLYMDYMQSAGQRSAETPVVINPQMATIYENCLTIAAVDATVLIMGESGTGKEVLANFIHQNSARKERPFLSINCGAIPENLLESELFGYEAGAFTGAQRGGKVGIFEAANTGTLLLDEMGELPKEMQVKLLRVLETRQITRVGAVKPIGVDVRIIVATNRDLAQRVKEGLFRSDLFYRINVMSVTIPPLRERPEDVVALSNHFLNLFNIQYDRNRTLSYDVYQYLAAYSWPGNVRELRNVIEQIVILSPKDEIPFSLVQAILPTSPGDVGRTGSPVRVTRPDKLERVVEEAERQLLKLAMRKHHSSRSIAKALGISQTTAVRKLKKYGMHPDVTTEEPENAPE